MPNKTVLTWEQRKLVWDLFAKGQPYREIAELLAKGGTEPIRDRSTIARVVDELPSLTPGQAEDLNGAAKEVWENFQEHFSTYGDILDLWLEDLLCPTPVDLVLFDETRNSLLGIGPLVEESDGRLIVACRLERPGSVTDEEQQRRVQLFNCLLSDLQGRQIQKLFSLWKEQLGDFLNLFLQMARQVTHRYKEEGLLLASPKSAPERGITPRFSSSACVEALSQGKWAFPYTIETGPGELVSLKLGGVGTIAFCLPEEAHSVEAIHREAVDQLNASDEIVSLRRLMSDYTQTQRRLTESVKQTKKDKLFRARCELCPWPLNRPAFLRNIRSHPII
jgi:hypothetical protein